MRTFCIAMAVLNAIMLILTGSIWFVLGALGFVIGAAALAWLELIQDRVIRELSKKCECPTCVANRSDEQ